MAMEGESVFTEDERQFLENLKTSPVWSSIIDRIAGDFLLPQYRPGQDAHPQFYRWIEVSVRRRERENIVRALTNGERGLKQALDSE